ncbi:MAG: lactoferrin/transferrin family TonB-dependent receptor [Neisseria sp.]|nr:lactoferrin/transferrin family TonB-dependent receptor [Neisseria sp.]
MKHLKQKTLVTALAVCFAPLYAYADAPKADTEVELQEIRVTAPKRVNRKTQEVTGLGKVVKTAETLEKEQVQGIRDLVRYDPGISVVEQGRGGSAGFSIRGVDKNRVQVSVDGIPQLQSYADTTSKSGGSGSMNEIEFENVSSVEISKGSNAAETGSGALGGSVNYYTKNVGDFIEDGKNWGLTSKTAFSSKDKRFAQTVGGAFSYNGFEGLLQYTHRKGKEISIHKDAARGKHTFYKLGAYENKYDLRGEPGQLADNLFRFEDCTGDECLKHTASLGVYPDGYTPGSRDPQAQPYTPEEDKQRNELMAYRKETLPSAAYTGSKRIRPNPMEYQSGSWLGRLGYRFSPEHYAGILTEHTRQKYDSRNMRHAAYYAPEARGELEHERKNSDGIWKNDPSEGFALLAWTRARFFEERHNKQRQGLAYRYTPSENTWADNLEINLDRQNIKIDTASTYAACSPYGDSSTTLNCKPSADKPGSYLKREQIKYKENHLVFNTKWNKTFDWDWSRHKVQAAAGFDRFDSAFDKTLHDSEAVKNYEYIGQEERTVNGKKYRVGIYRDAGSVMKHEDICQEYRLDHCARKPIKGSSFYVSLRDNMSLGKYVDLGLGFRLDRHSFKTDDAAIRSKTYLNKSWNAGLVVKPNNNWAVSYRASNGFRVPSFQDLYGYDVPGLGRDNDAHHIADLKPEKSFNQEIGLTFKGAFGNAELSVFDSRYRDLIAYAVAQGTQNGVIKKIGNFNLQNADLRGINFRSTIDLNGLWEKMPEGLSLNLAYNRIKAKRLFNNTHERFDYTSDYPLETIQPSRYVVGMNYDSPSEKWGVTANWTHSRGKNPQELISKVDHGDGKNRSKAATKAASRPWTTVDVSGYWKPWKKAALRAGVYNLFNHRYLMWETLRQSSSNSLAQQQVPGSNYAQFAAPGRNITVGFEMKF